MNKCIIYIYHKYHKQMGQFVIYKMEKVINEKEQFLLEFIFNCYYLTLSAKRMIKFEQNFTTKQINKLKIQITLILSSLFENFSVKISKKSDKEIMIKSNRKSEQIILRQEYNNRLNQNHESGSIGPESQINRLLQGQSKVRTEIDNINRTSRSISQRQPSQQRAFNSKITHHFTNQNNYKPHAESQVQPFIFKQNIFPHHYSSTYHHPSEPLSRIQRRSSSDSQVNTQIQTLNRLMEEYEILKKVISDEDDKSDDEEKRIENRQQINVSKQITNKGKAIMKKQSHISERYNYELQQAVPIIDIKASGTNQIKDKEVHIKQEEKHDWNFSKLKSKDKDKEGSKTKIKTKLIEKQDEDEYREIKEDEFSLSDSSDNDQKIITKKKAEQQIQPITTKLSLSAQRQPLKQQPITTTSNTIQQLMTKITTLQSALTQSALKIQQLLLQARRSKQKLRFYEQLQQKHLRLQSQLRICKQSESYLYRQLEMKEEENKRTERRCRLMKERVEILEGELKRREGELERLGNVVREYRDRQLVIVDHVGGDSEKKRLTGKVEPITLQASSLVMEQNNRLKQQLQEQQRRLTQFMQSIKQQSVSQLEQAKSYYFQLNSQLQEQLKVTLQQNYSLRNDINKLEHESRSQQLRSSRKIEQLSPKKHDLSHQKKQIKMDSPNHKKNITKSMHQTLISSQVEEIKQQLTKLQSLTVSELQSKQVISQLSTKIRQLQETIHQQQISKQHFIQQIQAVQNQRFDLQNELTRSQQQNNKLKQQNNTLRLENGHCKMQLNFIKTNQLQSTKRENLTIKNQLDYTKRQLNFIKNELQSTKRQLHQIKTTTISRQHHLLLETQKKRLSQQLQSLQKQRLSTMSLQDQQLYINLTTIKQEYMKLQAGYLQKAKECEEMKSRVDKQRREKEQLERQLQLVYRQNDNCQQQNHQLQQRLVSAEMRIKQNSFKTLQLTNLSQSSSMYKQKVEQLQQRIAQLEVQLSQKQSNINQLQLKNKQLSLQNELNNKNAISRLSLSSQEAADNKEQKGLFYQQLKLTEIQIHNLKSELKLKSQQLQQQQNHHQQIIKIHQQTHHQQLSLLKEQVYQLLQEKGMLLNESVKIPILEQIVNELKVKQKQHNKLTQGIRHLWMVKQVQYQNINQILYINRNRSHNQKPS